MRERDKLYTANKWNRPLFADVDRENQNIFDGIYGSSNIDTFDRAASQQYGANYGNEGFTLDDYMNSKGNNWFGLSKKDNPFSKGNIGTTMKGIGGAAAAVGSQVNTGDPRGLYDTLDPVYHLAGGRESGAGNALSDTGVGLFNAGAQSGNGWLMLAGAGAKVLGGLTNAAFGLKTDKDRLNRINQNIADFNSSFGASSLDDIRGFGALANPEGIYKGGWFSGGKAKKKNEQTVNSFNNALSFAQRGQTNTVDNMWREKLHDELADRYAFGGPLGTPVYGNTGMGAIDYGFMSDYLTAKNKQAENKNTASNPFAGVANNFFSDGGSIHIKHPGRLTRLKERTGKTEAELWAEGKPEVRKMITFARNSRAWSKANGGKIHRNSVEVPNFFDFGGDKDDVLPGYGGGSFSGAGQGNGFVVEKNTYKEAKNFNDAYDKAVKEGRQYFMFQGKKYNTKKEENPIREFNNRWVGERRVPNEKRSGYGVDYGPIGGPLANLPVVRDTYTGTPDRPPQLEYNPDAYDTFYHRFTMPTRSSERHKIVPGRPVRWEGDKLVYAFGGDMQTNSADFSTGLTHISAGGSHEESPYDGVQLGVDSEGKPNLVEEGEVIFNDYVFSDRIPIDDETKKKFHFPKKRDITYAEAAKKLEKEISERPADPISKASFNAQMRQLEEQQERQKQEMEAARAREAFEALSPEEQAGVMRYAQQQEQAAQEQAMQQETMAQQAQMQQPSPEEIAMAEQQQMGQPEVVEEQPVMAEGGHLYPWGDIKEMFNVKPPYAASIGAQYIPYTRDLTEEEVLKREQDPTFKAWTDYVNSNWDSEEVQNYLKALDAVAGGNHMYDASGNILEGARDYYNHARTGNHKWGYYHLTPQQLAEEAAAESAAKARIFHTVEGDDDYLPSDQSQWVGVGNEIRRETLPNGDTVIYHKRGTNAEAQQAKDAASDPAKGTKVADDWEVTPNYKNDKLRYAGLFGPAVGLGMQMLGIGKPDTGAFDNILEGYDRSGAALADYQPIGNYLRYTPMDIWFEQNRLNANARATDRAILNSGSNQGAKAAALLANGYNTQTASGDLYRKGLEYNDALRQQVAGFNRGTDQFNAEAYNRTALQNAETLNRQRQYRAQLGMQAAAQKADLDAGWYNGIYGNVAGIFKGIGDIGRENAQHNMIAEMTADGFFGPMSPRTNTGRRGKYLTFTKKAACGGKLNKKKGGK